MPARSRPASDRNRTQTLRYRREAVASIGDLARVGIHARLVPRTSAVMLGRIERREVPLYILGWMSDGGDGRVSYEYLLHSPGPAYGLDNGGAYSSPQVDALIERASTRMPIAERRQVLTQLGRLVYEEVPVVPLYRQVSLYAVSRGLAFHPRLDRRLRVIEMAWVNPGQ
jgi:peptide/nickel transport system substrate-binding protein